MKGPWDRKSKFHIGRIRVTLQMIDGELYVTTFPPLHTFPCGMEGMEDRYSIFQVGRATVGISKKPKYPHEVLVLIDAPKNILILRDELKDAVQKTGND